ncbi:AbrB/MazE/SpoVT family DNA-binding domain-containing protein [Burkholderia sp. SCN-KJ]|uniref:AbrB/MazE/SpoVT family DNA-binding domain-containing protein n=1 Tax=Burkholderia sp. SCN-KJ TaxID=2969248 RepID=UPI00214FC700|nr:AbrB/MazE/SpoVT family DNA-binding domain-containing protein [Burkholderia sp. SCN-KJ]MCR4471133.1 AbrB/MazE/SpoVT family DNA-binding domain-containing protein [Burkholderia sp. SCN-KJ]
MAEATLTSKGQVTIPADVRQALSLSTGAKLVFTLLDDGTVILRAKTRRLHELEGMLSTTAPAVPIDAMRLGNS